MTRERQPLVAGRDLVTGAWVTWPISVGVSHGLLRGPSGWGKSACVNSLVGQIIKHRPDLNVVVIDAKGGTIPEIHGFLAAMGDAAPRPDQVVAIETFGPNAVSVNPMTPIPGLLPSVQSNLVVTAVRGMVDGVGERMSSLLAKVTHAVMSATHDKGDGSLLDVARVIADEEYRHRLIRKIRPDDEDIRHWMLTCYDREPEASKSALLSRISWITAVPDARARLCAKAQLTGRDLLESRLTTVNLSGAPLGYTDLEVLMGSVLFARLVSGVFARTVTKNTRHTVIIIDEWQRIVTYAADELERCLSLARSQKCSFVLANQVSEQVSTVNPKLMASAQANCSMEVLFRPPRSAISHLMHALPLTGRTRDPQRPDRLLTPAQERDLLLGRMATLPKRHAFYVDYTTNKMGFLRTPNLDYARAERAAAAQPELIAAYRRGRLARPTQELLREAEPRLRTANASLPKAAKRSNAEARPKLVVDVSDLEGS